MTAIEPSAVRAGMTGTLLAHGALIAAILLLSQRHPIRAERIYEVNLVAAPAPAPEVHNAPPTAAPAAPVEKPVVRPTPVKRPPKPRPAHARAADKTPVTRAQATPAPGEKPSTGQDAVTLHQQGLMFPYPEYLNNIENQILRRWVHAMFRPGYEAQIAFVIDRDGTVPAASVEMVRGSGNLSFDLAAKSAIESASSARAFGALPSGFTSASLPILFDFKQVPREGP
ncbi:MAG: TonB C-terminal domain-containing protein [Gemmatimonadales bacterium]